MKKVIFDTDIGIDDAMALLFLHFARDVDLMAIVTGFGNANIETTTRNALYVKERFGIPAPVYQGAAGPIDRAMFDGYPDFVHGVNGLGDIDIPDVKSRPESSTGAQALVELPRRRLKRWRRKTATKKGVCVRPSPTRRSSRTWSGLPKATASTP